MEFQLKYFMQYSRAEIEEMYPWERDVLVGFYNQQKQEEKEQSDKETKAMEAKMPKYSPPSMPPMPKMPSYHR